MAEGTDVNETRSIETEIITKIRGDKMTEDLRNIETTGIPAIIEVQSIQMTDGQAAMKKTKSQEGILTADQATTRRAEGDQEIEMIETAEEKAIGTAEETATVIADETAIDVEIATDIETLTVTLDVEVTEMTGTEDLRENATLLDGTIKGQGIRLYNLIKDH